MPAPHADGAGPVQPAYSAAAGEEWADSFERYLTRAADQSARAMELSRELMAATARGEVAPSELEDKLRVFLDASASSYAVELAELTVRFLSTLISSGAAWARDLVEAIVPGAVAFDGAVPEFDEAGWQHWFETLTGYLGRVGADAARGCRSVLDRVAAGQLDPAQVAQTASTFLEELLPRQVGEAAGLCFNLLNELDELRSAYGEEFLTGVLARARPARDAEPGLDLTGPIGTTASARLSVMNTADETAVIRPVVTDVRRSDGVGPAFDPEVVIAPEEFELAPGRQTNVTVTVFLGEDAYAAGPAYGGALRVVAHDETLLELPLRIRATAGVGDKRASAEGPA